MCALIWSDRDQALQTATSAPVTRLAERATTGHICIEGDNLEVLKHLQHDYRGRIKLIYIDPPYNTGNSFVYHDDFAARTPKKAAVADTESWQHQLAAHAHQVGQRHENWLAMMAPRLMLARQLLRDDGVIAISIDAAEVAYLTLIADQIFGPANALGQIVWVSNLKGRQIGSTGPRRTHEYICLFARDATKTGRFTASAQDLEALMPQVYKRVTYPLQTDAYGTFVVKNQLYNTNGKFNEETARSMVYAIDYHPATGRVRTRDIDIARGQACGPAPGDDWVTIMPHPNRRAGLRYHAWRWSRTRVERDHADLLFRESRGQWRVYTKIRDFQRIGLKDIVIGPSTMTGIADLEAHALGDAFSYPKPVALIQLLVEAITGPDDIILDFFAGSGTTGEAVATQNNKDGGTRRAILVQKPETFTHPRFSNLAEVTRARLDAAGISYQQLKCV